mgnify:CR=1 FL=1
MDKKSARIRRAARARHMMREQGVTRLVVHRTPRHIYAQVIAPNGSEVLAAASTVEKAISEQVKYTGNKEAAAVVGKVVALWLTACVCHREISLMPTIVITNACLWVHKVVAFVNV